MESEERGPTLVALLVLLGDKPWNRNKDAGGSIPQLRTVMEVVKEICRAKRCPAAVPRVSHPLPGIRRSIRSFSNSQACDVLSSIQHDAFRRDQGTNHPRRRARPHRAALRLDTIHHLCRVHAEQPAALAHQTDEPAGIIHFGYSDTLAFTPHRIDSCFLHRHASPYSALQNNCCITAFECLSLI